MYATQVSDHNEIISLKPEHISILTPAGSIAPAHKQMHYPTSSKHSPNPMIYKMQ